MYCVLFLNSQSKPKTNPVTMLPTVVCAYGTAIARRRWHSHSPVNFQQVPPGLESVNSSCIIQGTCTALIISYVPIPRMDPQQLHPTYWYPPISIQSNVYSYLWNPSVQLLQGNTGSVGYLEHRRARPLRIQMRTRRSLIVGFISSDVYVRRLEAKGRGKLFW